MSSSVNFGKNVCIAFVELCKTDTVSKKAAGLKKTIDDNITKGGKEVFQQLSTYLSQTTPALFASVKDESFQSAMKYMRDEVEKLGGKRDLPHYNPKVGGKKEFLKRWSGCVEQAFKSFPAKPGSALRRVSFSPPVGVDTAAIECSEFIKKLGAEHEAVRDLLEQSLQLLEEQGKKQKFTDDEMNELREGFKETLIVIFKEINAAKRDEKGLDVTEMVRSLFILKSYNKAASFSLLISKEMMEALEKDFKAYKAKFNPKRQAELDDEFERVKKGQKKKENTTYLDSFDVNAGANTVKWKQENRHFSVLVAVFNYHDEAQKLLDEPGQKYMSSFTKRDFEEVLTSKEKDTSVISQQYRFLTGNEIIEVEKTNKFPDSKALQIFDKKDEKR